MPRPTIALAWFREEDWGTWLAVAPDFQPDRGHWLRRCEGQIAALEARGTEVVKVTVDPPLFVAWAQQNGRWLGTKERAACAALVFMRRRPTIAVS
jgi:hypothetical protein